MSDFYPDIRLVHIAAALTSVGLFLIRGLALFAGAGWAMATPLRYLGYTVDTVLLAAALVLMTIVQQYPFVHSWLTVKLMLLIVYVVLGIFAFRRNRRFGLRLGCWLAALAIYGFIYSVARAHDPLGFLSAIQG